jgi:hypothetical protein
MSVTVQVPTRSGRSCRMTSTHSTSLDPYFLYQRIAVALERIADALDRESAAPVPEQPKSSGR